MSLLDDVNSVEEVKDLILSPGSPSTDGKQGTGMQISLMVEARLHNEPADRVLPVETIDINKN